MYELIPSEKYLDDLLSFSKKAKERIYIQAMHVVFNDKFSEFINELILAKKRGVDVRLNIDDYSKVYNSLGHRYLHISKKKISKCQKDATKSRFYIDKLLRAGVDVLFINEYKYNKKLAEYIPFLGRNHMKITVIDDISYIGGINLSSKSLNYIDFMLRTDNKSLLDALLDLFFKSRNNINFNDYKINLDLGDALLVDSGKTYKSIIYDTVLKEIYDSKDSILYISQFLPDFKILKALKFAHSRGVDVNIITHASYVSEKKYRTFIEHSMFNFSNLNIRNIYLSKDRYVHAKMVIIDKGKESEKAIFGSHNFSTFGVLFGTKEISLLTRNKQIIDMLYLWYNSIKPVDDKLIKYATPTQSSKHI